MRPGRLFAIDLEIASRARFACGVCVSRAGLKAWPSASRPLQRRRAETRFQWELIETKKMKRKGKVRDARTFSPACGAHALPDYWPRLIGREHRHYSSCVFNERSD